MKSIFGLDEKIVAALSNGTCGLFGVVACVMERENKFVRFHGMQSIITFFGLGVLGWIISSIVGFISVIPVLGWMVALVLGLASKALGILTIVAWVYLTYTSYKGQMFRVPVIGDAVWDQINK